MDSLIQWECNHILLGRDMVKRPQWLSTAPGFVESRDALKTRMDSFRQWEFQPDPSFCGYVWNSALTKRIRALFFDASRAALKTKMDFLIQWKCITTRSTDKQHAASYSVETLNLIRLALDMSEIPPWQRESLVGWQRESVPCFSMHRVLHWKPKWTFLFNENVTISCSVGIWLNVLSD